MKKIIVPAIIFTTTGIVIQLLNFYSIFNFQNQILLFAIFIFQITLFFFLLRWIKRKYYPNGISFKQVLINGILICAFSSVILSVFLFVYLSYIDPAVLDTQKKNFEKAKQEAIDKQGPSAEKLFRKMPMQQLLTPGGQALSALSSNIVYLLISLICAAILKTKNPDEIELNDSASG